MCNSIAYRHGCCCEPGQDHGHGVYFRHFISRDERKQFLEHYEDELKKELAGVEERIKEIEKE